MIFSTNDSSPSQAGNRRNNFSVLGEAPSDGTNYGAIDKSDILNIHKYLMIKSNI